LTLHARVKPLALLLAFAGAQALAGFVLALALPGACCLFVLPALSSALALAGLPRRPLGLACAALVLAAGHARRAARRRGLGRPARADRRSLGRDRARAPAGAVRWAGAARGARVAHD